MSLVIGSTARARGALLLAVVSLSLAGCAREKKEETARPVRFAVIAAPEIGADDGDLVSAVTELSRMKDIAFVLVPGPLLASDADKTSVALLQNGLGQIAAPVYVGFSTAAVASDAASAKPSKLPKGALFVAVESMGPGAGHAVSYFAQPEEAGGTVVNVLGPDGAGAVSPVPPEARRLVQLIAIPGEVPNADALEADILVTLAAAGEVEGRGYAVDYRKAVRETERKFPGDAVLLRVAPLSGTKAFVIATLDAKRITVESVPVDAAPGTAKAHGEPASLLLPPPRDARTSR